MTVDYDWVDLTCDNCGEHTWTMGHTDREECDLTIPAGWTLDGKTYDVDTHIDCPFPNKSHLCPECKP